MNKRVNNEKEKKLSLQTIEKIEKILESNKKPNEKKIALFNVIKNLKVGEMKPDKKKRINYLLEGHLHAELAKQYMREYKKETAKSFKTEKTDWFISNYRVGYIPNLPGKLILTLDKSESLEEEVEKLDKFAKRPIKYKHRDYVEFIEGIKREGAGRKRLFGRIHLYHLIHSIQTRKAKTLIEISDYIFQKTGLRISKSTIHLTLKRIKYSYQVIPYRHPKQKYNLPEVIEFMERANKLPPRQILATDESGHPLNLALKRELIKDAVNAEVFANFLARVELSNEGKHYLLLDNIAFHKSIKVKELLTKKNIEPRYIVASNPYLNPVEEVFNVIKQYVRKQRPRTEEELRKSSMSAFNELFVKKGVLKVITLTPELCLVIFK
ncbi:15528_t:CDS:2 [Entrophospora sp. SA101]|nr:15528_t:CDS:2 [Entrophospora sp. SA101]CAJ0851466.1 775_t:CDS:2 [Entrophospora sp. SA101]